MSTNDDDDAILAVFIICLIISIIVAVAFQSVLVFVGCLVATMWITRKCIS